MYPRTVSKQVSPRSSSLTSNPEYGQKAEKVTSRLPEERQVGSDDYSHQKAQSWHTYDVVTADWDANTTPIGTKIRFRTASEGTIIGTAEDENHVAETRDGSVESIAPELIIETMTTETQVGYTPVDAWQAALDQDYDSEPKQPYAGVDTWQNFQVNTWQPQQTWQNHECIT